jgi:hypothetical protein
MCSCQQGTCPGGCGCGCSHTPVHFIAYDSYQAGSYQAPCGVDVIDANHGTAYALAWVDTTCRDCLAVSPMAREALPDLKDPVAVETWLAQ